MDSLAWRCRILAATAVLAAACGGQAGDDTSQARAAADTAPAYRAVTLAGDSVTLAEQRGNVVLLNIWATWCHPCVEELPLLQKLHQADSARGLRIVGVSIDARGAEQRVQQFAKEMGVTYRIWLDPDDRASFLFRAIGVPASYLIDREGQIVWRKLGPIEEGDRSLESALENALR